MPLKKRLIDADVFQRLDAHAIFQLQHPVYQQNGKAVREGVQNCVDVHHGVGSNSKKLRMNERPTVPTALVLIHFHRNYCIFGSFSSFRKRSRKA